MHLGTTLLLTSSYFPLFLLLCSAVGARGVVNLINVVCLIIGSALEKSRLRSRDVRNSGWNSVRVGRTLTQIVANICKAKITTSYVPARISLI